MRTFWLGLLLVVIILAVLIPIGIGVLILIGLPIRHMAGSGSFVADFFRQLPQMPHMFPRFTFGVPMFMAGRALLQVVFYGLIIWLVVLVMRNRSRSDTQDIAADPIIDQPSPMVTGTDGASPSDEVATLRQEVELLRRKVSDLEKDEDGTDRL